MSDQHTMPLRVFISYSHQDLHLAQKVYATIEGMGLVPIWDVDFAIGCRFSEQIKISIAHAHIFLPIITETSSLRGWVHQEIGYALALNIPILPVAWGELPREMLHELHAVVLPAASEEHDSALQRKLTRVSVNAILAEYRDKSHASYETAALSEDRAILMARYANQVKHWAGAALLRQKGGLSSLHIPNQLISAPAWTGRYGSRPKSEFHCRCLRDERIALEHHAREAGFRIIIDPNLTYDWYDPPARQTRLGTLIEFLSSLDDGPDYQVAFSPDTGLHANITILGDWFYAESVSPSKESGYRQTIFTRHAPSMQEKIDLFDMEFSGLLTARGWEPEDSRVHALEHLNELASSVAS